MNEEGIGGLYQMPSEDCWVQIELTPSGNRTGCNYVNLADIVYVQVWREDKKVTKIIAFLKTSMVIDFDIDGANNFLTQWEKYKGAEITHRDPEKEPSVINVATTKDLIPGARTVNRN